MSKCSVCGYPESGAVQHISHLEREAVELERRNADLTSRLAKQGRRLEKLTASRRWEAAVAFAAEGFSIHGANHMVADRALEMADLLLSNFQTAKVEPGVS
jgi:hypothetical protein